MSEPYVDCPECRKLTSGRCAQHSGQFFSVVRTSRFPEETAAELARLRAENAALRARLEEARHDVDAYRGALGYPAQGDHDGRLSEGSYPQNGIAQALESENAALRARAEQAEAERDALRAEVGRLREALLFAEQFCPCGARPESLQTHPHIGGCQIADALTSTPFSAAALERWKAMERVVETARRVGGSIGPWGEGEEQILGELVDALAALDRTEKK